MKELVSRGLSHCLSQILPMKIKILKYHFKHSEAKSSLRLARADTLLKEKFTAVQNESTTSGASEKEGEV